MQPEMKSPNEHSLMGKVWRGEGGSRATEDRSSGNGVVTISGEGGGVVIGLNVTRNRGEPP
jgi:hypothetical protein